MGRTEISRASTEAAQMAWAFAVARVAHEPLFSELSVARLNGRHSLPAHKLHSRGKQSLQDLRFSTLMQGFHSAARERF